MNFCASSKCFYLKRIGNGKNFADAETRVKTNPPLIKNWVWISGIFSEEKITHVHQKWKDKMVGILFLTFSHIKVKPRFLCLAMENRSAEKGILPMVFPMAAPAMLRWQLC
jgi:hypothetical protein